MGKPAAAVLVLAILLVAGAAVFIRTAGNPDADWASFEKIAVGRPATQLKNIGKLRNEYRLQSEARDDGFAQDFAEAKAAGAARLVVYQNGNALFLFGIDREETIAWKLGRPQ